MREIEIKARVGDRAGLLATMKQQGVHLSAPVKQHDVVYSPPGQQDYAKDTIWLRIRTENDAKVIWTLKKDTGRRHDSIEHEVEVSNEAELATMLQLMGMGLYSDLTKTRMKGHVGDIEICVDEVDGLGCFIEVEKIVANDHDYQPVADELWEFLGKCGITKADHETGSYDVLLNEKAA